MHQLSFLPKQDLFYGGIINPTRLRKRKTSRTLTTKKPIHLVLKAVNEFRVKESNQKISLRAFLVSIESYIKKYAIQFGIRVYDKSVQRDHIHLLILISSRENYRKFIRALTGVLARLLKIKWLTLPFTRVVEWGKSFAIIKKYIFQNELEVLGKISYVKRKNWYAKIKNGLLLRL